MSHVTALELDRLQGLAKSSGSNYCEVANWRVLELIDYVRHLRSLLVVAEQDPGAADVIRETVSIRYERAEEGRQ